jgi:hypothetical protein
MTGVEVETMLLNKVLEEEINSSPAFPEATTGVVAEFSPALARCTGNR